MRGGGRKDPEGEDDEEMDDIDDEGERLCSSVFGGEHLFSPERLRVSMDGGEVAGQSVSSGRCITTNSPPKSHRCLSGILLDESMVLYAVHSDYLARIEAFKATVALRGFVPVFVFGGEYAGCFGRRYQVVFR